MWKPVISIYISLSPIPASSWGNANTESVHFSGSQLKNHLGVLLDVNFKFAGSF